MSYIAPRRPRVGFWISLALLVGLCGLVRADVEQVFRLDVSDWDQKPRTVHLAGSFNGWSTTATPMTADPEQPDLFRVTVVLSEGVHHYKFVIDGNRWINDPAADRELEVSDGHGGMNSGVLVGPDARRLPPPRDNHVNLEVVLHNPADPRDLNVADAQTVRLRVRAQRGDVQSVRVHVENLPGGFVELRRLKTEMGYDIFGGIAHLPAQFGELLRYRIELRDGEAAEFLHPANDDALFEARLHTDFITPDWARHAVWYQIFPERFRNGDPSNDPGDFEFETLLPWTIDWWKTHVEHGEVAGDENFYHGHGNVWRRRFGGDLQGVREKLPYLRSLGVNAIYFNPVFEGESMHKYDTADFRHIDDNFGVKGDIPIPGETDDPATWQWSESDKVFLEFIQEARRQGFKVVIDGVFNHVGRAHPFFMDVLEKGPNSKYADWFAITDWGDPANWRKHDRPFEVHGRPGGIQWEAWDQPNGYLPTFKKHPTLGLAPGPREHIFDITRRWLAPDGDPSRGIDGWRLDVPGDIPHPFWVDWRKLVKEINPDAYIVGEIWQWAEPWLQGDQFDAVMNYQFAMPAQEFFVNQRLAITPTQFAERLTRLVYHYPFQVALVQQNLFDSHDTDRLASMFVNPDRPYDGANRPQDNAINFPGGPYDKRKPTDTEYARKKQAIALQMTFVGAPMLYYGTEAGMWSPDDPSNRMPMVWPDLMPYQDPQVEFRQSMFDFCQRMIAIRHHLPALRLGGFHPTLLDDERGIFAMARTYRDQTVHVVLNRSAETVIVELPVERSGRFRDLVDPAHTGVVFEDDAPDARPTLAPTDAKSFVTDTATLRLELAPWQTRVIVRE